jgi:hypothetical protein
MKRPKTEKGFDCIEFKRRVQAEIYEEIKELSSVEEIEYFRRRAANGLLGEWWKALGRRSESAVKAEVRGSEPPHPARPSR